MTKEALASPKDAALKLALDALEYWDVHGGLHQPTEEAITALRLAIDVQNMASESTYKAALAQQADHSEQHLDMVKAQQKPWCMKMNGCKTKCEDCPVEVAQQEPEFIKHEVENADDWSEWVCPDPKGYLMKCCDCGLVHEAEFGVVRYKSETEREDCEPVEDPNLQAVFRIRRSEQWSPEDTAHRAGGLPMEEPEQEPVAWIHNFIEGGISIGKRPADLNRHPDRWTALYKDPTPCQTCQALARTVMLDQTSHDTTPPQPEERNFCSRCGKRTADLTVIHTCTPPQRKPLTDDEIWEFWCSRPEVLEGEDDSMEAEFVTAVRAVLAAHNIKENT